MKRLPPGAVSPSLTRLFLGVASVHARTGRCTVREAMDAAGYSSVGSGHHMLLQLRDLGLVTWEDGHAGTLRPAVAPARRRAA